MTAEYKETDLDELLKAKDAPVGAIVGTPAFDFMSNAQRNSIGNYALGTFSAAHIVAGTIVSGVVYAGTVSGSQVTAGTITAAVGYLGTLSANQINSGTLILGGTLNGNGMMQIKNAAGSVVVQGDNLGHHYYSAAGNELVRVNDEGLFGYGTVQDVVTFKSSPSGTVYGRIGFTSGTPSLWIESLNSKSMYLSSADDIWLSSSDNLNVLSDNFYITSNGAGTIQSSGTAKLVSTGSDTVIEADDDIIMTCVDDINLACGGDFILNGSVKTAIMQTSKGFNALYTNESPENWFMDFTYNKGSLDPLFKEVTVSPYRYISAQDESGSAIWQVWGKRRGFDHLRFEEKSEEDYKSNTRFWSKAYDSNRGIPLQKKDG